MFRGVEYTELIGGELNENNVDWAEKINGVC
jgi:hypothetical protein